MEADYATGEFQEITVRTRSIIQQLRELSDAPAAVDVGAGVAGIAYALTYAATGQIWQLISSLVDLDLLPPPPPTSPIGGSVDGESDEREPPVVTPTDGPLLRDSWLGEVALRQLACDGMGDLESASHRVIAQHVPRLLCVHVAIPEFPFDSGISTFADLGLDQIGHWPPIERIEERIYRVCGEEKEVTVVQDLVIHAMLEAGPSGLTKDELEGIASGGRGVLGTLRRDDHWRQVIAMAGRRGMRYRLVSAK